MKPKIPHHQMLVNWYINMYAYYNQQAYTRPALKAHFQNKMETCIDMFLTLSSPLTLTQILDT